MVAKWTVGMWTVDKWSSQYRPRQGPSGNQRHQSAPTRWQMPPCRHGGRHVAGIGQTTSRHPRGSRTAAGQSDQGAKAKSQITATQRSGQQLNCPTPSIVVSHPHPSWEIRPAQGHDAEQHPGSGDPRRHQPGRRPITQHRCLPPAHPPIR